MCVIYFLACLATFLTLTLPVPCDFTIFLGLAPKAFFLAAPDTFDLLELGFDLTALVTFPPFAFFFATSLLFFVIVTFLTSLPLAFSFSFLRAAFSTCKSLNFSSGD